MRLHPLASFLLSEAYSVTLRYILISEIFASGDSYTDTGFDLTEQQPSREDPFGNPTYNPNSPYIKWIEYLTMTYNDSKVETYNFAVSGATVDQDLIDKGSAFSTQVGEKFLSNYGQEDHTWEPQTTLFSVFFGINDNVFSNKSEGLFDRVFESYSRTLDKVSLPQSLYSLIPISMPFSVAAAAPHQQLLPAAHRGCPEFCLPERTAHSPRSQPREILLPR